MAVFTGYHGWKNAIKHIFRERIYASSRTFCEYPSLTLFRCMRFLPYDSAHAGLTHNAKHLKSIWAEMCAHICTRPDIFDHPGLKRRFLPGIWQVPAGVRPDFACRKQQPRVNRSGSWSEARPEGVHDIGSGYLGSMKVNDVISRLSTRAGNSVNARRGGDSSFQFGGTKQFWRIQADDAWENIPIAGEF